MNADGDSERKVGEIKTKNSEVKDPEIKFFGKSIELPAAAAGICDAGGKENSIKDFTCSSNSVFGECNLNGDAEDQEANKGQICQNQDDAKEENQAQSMMSDELKDDPKAQSTDSDVGAEQNSKAEEDQSETKALKKPDKILPCPRCNSMDTKFCYFNNYNVNQPRHFCKNCHRYWTAGGTMRNMPVGAGRHKNKYNAGASQFQNLPEALQTARMDLPNGFHHPVTVLNPNETVIPYTSDTPPSESMATVSHESKENGDDHSVPNEEGKTGIPELILNCHPFPQQVPCFPGAPWPWHSVQWCAPPSVPPTFPPASFPLPFYSTPPPYWGWNVPWFIPPTPMPLNPGPNSPTLGKHSRDDDEKLKPEEETGKEEKREKCLWVPKTLRICDPKEAAKSSIWATLGIKNDRADSVNSGGGSGLFKAFQRQTKGEEKTTQVSETATVLQANPAALSRSLNFHESS